MAITDFYFEQVVVVLMQDFKLSRTGDVVHRCVQLTGVPKKTHRGSFAKKTYDVILTTGEGDETSPDDRRLK